MDITTVLEIIKMIETKLANLIEDIPSVCEGDTPSRDELPDYQYLQGEINSLDNLRDHLQGFIEGQLDAEENKSAEH